jgi:hypothetical protein
VAPVVPPVPAIRLDWGEAWHAEWVRAHRAMAPWERVPSLHLIDDVARNRPRTRGWIRHAWDIIAATTHGPDERLQPDGRIRFTRVVLMPDTMGIVRLRVILDHDHHTIVTAFDE